MTDEQKKTLEVKFPKELPKEHTDTEKLTQARWRIAQLEKMLDERKDADMVRRQLWFDVVIHNSKLGQKLSESVSDANLALQHYDKTFYGH